MRNRDPRTLGLGTQGLRVLRAVFSANATSQTHGYVLYVVAMHTEGVIYSRQHYLKLFSDLFDPQSSLLSVLQCQALICRVKNR